MYLKVQQHVFIFLGLCTQEENDTLASDLHYLEKDLITCSLDKYLLNELDE